MTSAAHLAITVDVGDGAQMTAPTDLEWHLRYGRVEEIRFTAASAVASFSYLIMECSKEEAWRRIKLMRAAIKANANIKAIEKGD